MGGEAVWEGRWKEEQMKKRIKHDTQIGNCTPPFVSFQSFALHLSQRLGGSLVFGVWGGMLGAESQAAFGKMLANPPGPHTKKGFWGGL